jgi:hypothetical protein
MTVSTSNNALQYEHSKWDMLWLAIPEKKSPVG